MTPLKQSLKVVRRNTLANLAILNKTVASVAPLIRRSTEATCYSPHLNRQSVNVQFQIDKLRPTEQIFIKPKQLAKKHSLVIFDKDGTLICFNSMWVPWAKALADGLCAAANMNICQQIYELLGLCPMEQRVRDGLLAHGTMAQIRERCLALLVEFGIEKRSAVEMVKSCLQECNSSSPGSLQQIGNLTQLFSELKANNIKIAVCTADNRAGTISTLQCLGIEHFVDFVMCGDDFGSMPKPNPHNALHICRMLGVHPEEAVMVGDTVVDVEMGRLANLGTTVGVLSGIGDTQELRPHADHIVNHVGELISKLLGQNNNSENIF